MLSFGLIISSCTCFRFLTKLLTEDLPKLFVRPKKIVLDFQKGKAVGPVTNDFRSGEMNEGNKDYVGELSVTVVDARKLSYLYGNYFLVLVISNGYNCWSWAVKEFSNCNCALNSLC